MTKGNLERKGFIWLAAHQLRDTKAGTQAGQESGGTEPQTSTAYGLAPHDFLFLPYTDQDHLPRGGTAHIHR